MSGQPVVPSKDALRALRSLVYSPPAAIIGTAGALCGVAALHYNERTKLRRVEKILETKRKLHSISKGRGSARLALMFEAAERGDDFTMSRNTVPKPSLSRRQSGLAVQHESQDNTNWRPFIREAKGLTNTRVIPLDLDTDKPADGLVQDARRMPCNLQPPDSNRLRFELTYYVRATDDITSDTCRHLLWSEMRKSGSDRRRANMKNISRILERTSDTTHEPGGLVEQSSTDLNPILEYEDIGLNHIDSAQTAQTPDGPKLRSIMLDAHNSIPFTSNSFSSLRPWPSIEEAEDTEEMKDHRQTQTSPCDEQIEDPDLYIALDAETPSNRTENDFPSRYNFDHPRIMRGMSSIGVKRYKFVYTMIMNTKTKHGTRKALLLLERTMERYTATDNHSDFALVQALFLDCVRQFGATELSPIIWRFVAKFLHGDMPRLEVVSFLYPRLGAGSRSNKQYYYYLAHRYLENVCEEGCSVEQQTDELRKIILGTQMAGIDLHEHLMVPVLRSLCHIGRMSAAQALFDEMTSAYKIQTTSYTLQILVKGYARAGNWSKIKAILDDCHGQGLPLQKVYGFAGLIVSIVRDHALFEPVDKVINFVTHSIRSYGIHPVSSMTTEIVSLCMRQRRYDLIASWLNMVRTEFPFIETGTNSSTFAFEIACVWKEIDASCEDILDGCRAIAQHCLRDPFSTVFRATISEAATRYLTPRLAELRNILGPEIPDLPIVPVRELRGSLQELRINLATKNENPRAKLLLTELLHQCNALLSVNALCGGDDHSRGHIPRSRYRRNGQQNNDRKLTSQLPSSLSDVQNALMSTYAQRERAGKPIEHDSLRDTVVQLVQQDRQAHAFKLIQSIYESRWAQPSHGLEFDVDLFLEWMKTAWRLKSSVMLRTVLWAILDASPQLRVNSQIILLARIAAPKTHQQRNKHARTPEVDEVEYLRLRLKRRHWFSSPEKKLHLQLREWEGLGKNPQLLTE